nr:hypothetical protein [Tanacetum cinerariifolium]
MSLELADKSIQYPRGIAENVLIKVDKCILSIDFVILDMREDSRIPIILRRPFLVTERAMIDDDECYEIDNLDETIHLEAQELLEDDQMDSVLVSNLEKCIIQSNPDSDDSEEPIRRITQDDTAYLKTQEVQGVSSKFQSHQKIKKKRHSRPYGTFAYRRMLFGLCNAPSTFQRCMTAIFHDMVKDFMEVFMDDFSVFGAVLGQRIKGRFKPIYYASKTLNDAQAHYTTTEKELLEVVFSFDKFRPYLILSKTVVYTDHSALKHSKALVNTLFAQELILENHHEQHIRENHGDPHDDAHPEGENSAKKQKMSKHGTFVFGESSSGEEFVSDQGPSTSGNQEKLDDFDFWTNSYATDDDDEIHYEKVSQELMDEMSHSVDEAKLCEVVDEIKEIIVTQHPQRLTPVVQIYQRDPKALALSLVNQDLLYLKKGSSGPEKIVMSLHKFPAVIDPDDDIKERTSRWVDKCVKKFNPYARYNVKHWKNPHAKIFYIKKQKDLGKPKDVVYSNSDCSNHQDKLGTTAEHKFITEIVSRRENGSIVSITELDYKNLNKNDIKDMYLLVVNHKVDNYAETNLLSSLLVFIRSMVIWERVYDFQLGVESYQQKVNLTAPIITFPGIEKFKVFFIVFEPVYGIIYKNIKKEKRVMRHQEVHKSYNATLNRVLEGLKSYNNNVNHGYATQSLSNEDVEYLQLFEEEIETVEAS